MHDLPSCAEGCVANYACGVIRAVVTAGFVPTRVFDGPATCGHHVAQQ